MYGADNPWNKIREIEISEHLPNFADTDNLRSRNSDTWKIAKHDLAEATEPKLIKK